MGTVNKQRVSETLKEKEKVFIILTWRIL